MKLKIGRTGCGSRVALWVAAVVFTCTTSGLSFSKDAGPSRVAPAGKAVVYVYREASIYGMGESFDLYSNGHSVARITNGGYYEFEVSPGQVALGVHEVVIPIQILTHIGNNLSLDSHPLYTFHAQAGQTYYVRFKLGFPEFTMTPVKKDEAVAAMAGMKRFDHP